MMKMRYLKHRLRVSSKRRMLTLVKTVLLKLVKLSKLSSLELNFDEGYDNDGEGGLWCDLIGLEEEQDYDECEIPETQVEGVIKEEDVNVSEDCPVETDSANKEIEDPPPLPVDGHISIEEDDVNKMNIPELKEEF